MTRKKHKKPELLKLDLGCGPNPKEGFVGVDAIEFNDRVQKFDLRKPWPWADGSVSEVHCSHFVEHLTAQERCHFFNELQRVLGLSGYSAAADGKPFATIIVPHWSSCRAYGDPTHVWPPMGDFFWYYLDRDWREANAPHTDKKHLSWGYNCNLECVWGYSFNTALNSKNEEYRNFAIGNYREAIHDMICTVKRKD